MHVFCVHREHPSVAAMCLISCDTPLIQQGLADSQVTCQVEKKMVPEERIPQLSTSLSSFSAISLHTFSTAAVACVAQVSTLSSLKCTATVGIHNHGSSTT